MPRIHTGGGLVLMWTDVVDIQISTYSKNHIDAVVHENPSCKGFRLTGFYGNPETHRRKESWALLKHLSHYDSFSPWVCMRDFNEILDSRERLGSGVRPEWQI